jgi:hypothetical protein
VYTRPLAVTDRPVHEVDQAAVVAVRQLGERALFAGQERGDQPAIIQRLQRRLLGLDLDTEPARLLTW